MSQTQIKIVIESIIQVLVNISYFYILFRISIIVGCDNLWNLDSCNVYQKQK